MEVKLFLSDILKKTDIDPKNIMVKIINTFTQPGIPYFPPHFGQLFAFFAI